MGHAEEVAMMGRTYEGAKINDTDDKLRPDRVMRTADFTHDDSRRTLQAELEVLEDQVNKAIAQVGELRERLKLVMRPDMEEGSAESDERALPETQPSAMISTARAITRRVYLLQSLLNDTDIRLEL